MIGNFRSNIVPPIVILMVTAFHLPRFFASCLTSSLFISALFSFHTPRSGRRRAERAEVRREA